jgi:hypothetical protein
MNRIQLLQLLESLGKRLGSGGAIEVNVVGGAAGLLSGLLPGYMTTSDMDIVQVRPPKDVEELLSAAQVVADETGMNRGWMNIDAGLFSHAIPDGWEARRAEVRAFGRLHVYVISRADLIATKFFAHRARDREHLREMHVTAEEKEFVRRYLKALHEKLPNEATKIDMALHLLEDWT